MNSMKKPYNTRASSAQSGFTLIELIVIIAALGILSAVAIPRFITLGTEARIASINATVGSINSAVALAVAKYTAAGLTGTQVNMNGVNVTVNTGTGIPTGAGAGIGNAVQTTGMAIDYTGSPNITFRPSGGSATCQVTYNGISGATSSVTTGC